MEVRGSDGDPGLQARQRFEAMRDSIARRDRARVRQAREVLESLSERRQEIRRAAREEAAQHAERTRERTEAERAEHTRDRVEISPAAREAAHPHHAHDAGREERVRRLADEHRAGGVNTPERVDRAAGRLLGAQD